MKTTVKNLEITEQLATIFKSSYKYKMGGTQTVVFPNGEKFNFDDREYYSGRGSKYNSSIKHDIKGEVVVTVAQLKNYVSQVNESISRAKENQKFLKAKNAKIKESLKNNIYSIDSNGFVELSNEEYYYNKFDAQRLANTLKISLEDALLLNSEGKTYVFAKSEDGNVYELYHADLSCNHLSINVSIATPKRIAEFIPTEWQNAPYANLLGQTSNTNHFVC